MKKGIISTRQLNIIVNFSLLIISILSFFTGIIKILNLYIVETNFDAFTAFLTPIHDWTGIFLVIISTIHLVIHRRWIVAMTKQILSFEKFGRKEWNYLIDIGMLISLILVATTGIIKLPLLVANQEIIYNYSIFLMQVHDWSGFSLVVLSFIHIFLHRNWLSIKLKKAYEIPSFKIATVITLIVMIFGFIFVPILSTPRIPDDQSYNIQGTINIESIGKFSFNPNETTTVRPDLFRESHFSVYDILVNLNKSGKIKLDAHFNESMNTYVVDGINDTTNWWYKAYYQGGWWEDNVYRMDHYPYKDGMTIKFYQTSDFHLQRIHGTWVREIQRFRTNDGEVIIPKVRISSPTNDLDFFNVSVTPHNLRLDYFQKDVITAIDIILSLGEQGKITYDLTWYDTIGNAEINSYYVERINEDEAYGGCGFVYETGDEEFPFFQGNHIHITSDTRIINSPQYSRWLWICL